VFVFALRFASELGKQQRRVVSRATAGDPNYIEVAALVGWSLGAQQILHDELKARADWQLQRFGNIVVGGYVCSL
jgi:hypothetical protein